MLCDWQRRWLEWALALWRSKGYTSFVLHCTDCILHCTMHPLFSTNLPLVVSTWYAQALTVLPEFANTVAAARRPMARPSTPLRVARLLSTNQVALLAQPQVVNLAENPVLKYTTLPDPHA